jgi:hypothetical protein
MIFGPYSPIGNYSAISVAEVQVSYIIKQLQFLKCSGFDTIESDPIATANLTRKMDQAMKQTVWMSGCDSWYLSDNGKIQMWPWTFERFEKDLSRIQASEFHLSCSQAKSNATEVVLVQKNSDKVESGHRDDVQQPFRQIQSLQAAVPRSKSSDS